ncbi:hypothetical protein ElyMa_004758800 [Elysia marginata]|uniref:Peptidase A2 domain-containing protein n=1 Tax=Elysia marginata TaxID=1093978 RepID=A0AAV4IF08_9GAST|nr:hypothetical protein ElyMa_004758800 [Elysia marginata]
MSSSTHAPISVPVDINGQTVQFQLDTGAALTVITDKDFQTIADGKILMSQCGKQLQTYTGETVPVLGECVVDVRYRNQAAQLPLVVVEGEGPPLLGRNWLQQIKLNWKDIFVIQRTDDVNQGPLNLEKILKNNSAVFGTGANDTEHLQTLQKILKLVSDKGLKINLEKNVSLC